MDLTHFLHGLLGVAAESAMKNAAARGNVAGQQIIGLTAEYIRSNMMPMQPQDTHDAAAVIARYAQGTYSATEIHSYPSIRKEAIRAAIKNTHPDTNPDVHPAALIDVTRAMEALKRLDT